MLQRSAELARLVEAHRSERVVVCGMGGSSLAPLVLGRAYGAPLEVLDTTHPAALRRLDVDGALFVISSKSGSTVETRCHFDHLWDRTGKRSGAFLVITDPGLAARAAREGAWDRGRRRGADDRRPLLRAVGVRARARGARRRRRRRSACARRGDARRLPARRRQPRSRARRRAGGELGRAGATRSSSRIPGVSDCGSSS